MERMDMDEELISSKKRNILERHWKFLYAALGVLVGCLLTIGITYLFFSLGKDKVQRNVHLNGHTAAALNGSQQLPQKGQRQSTISKEDFKNLSALLKAETDKSKNELKSFLQEYLQTLLTTRERNTQEILLQTLGNYSRQELSSIKKSKDDITIILTDIKNGNFSNLGNVLRTESVNSRDDIKRILKEYMRNDTMLNEQNKNDQLTLLQNLRNDSKSDIQVIADSKYEIVQLLGDMKNKTEQDLGKLENVLKTKSTEATSKSLYEELQHIQEKINDLMRVLEDRNNTRSNRTSTPTAENMMDCVDWQRKGFTENGVYNITPNGTTTAIQVYCDLTTDGGGWLVFQRRIDGTTNFDRNWIDYENGFGNVAKEYWLGNKYLHDLTSSPTELRIDVEDWSGIKKYAKYSTFTIGDATSKYTLYVGGYSGNAGNSMAFHHTVKFSTKDQDNEKTKGGCAKRLKGAWWHDYCGHSSLNGEYIRGGGYAGHNKGINWQKWKGDNYSMKSASMMLRRT